jgi:outer membrane protein assembly factor BamB
MRIRLLLSATLSLGLACLAVAGDTWPQFRGLHGTGISDSTGLPITWSEKDNVVWKTPIHDKGWSSPVVWGKQIWLTTARVNGTEMFALCIDRDTGRIVHDIKVFTVEKPAFCHPANSYASPTPAIEDGRVYVSFGTYGTACLDTKTGKKLWERRDLHCDHFRGPASSPIIWRDLLFLNFDGFDVQYVVALDKATGRTVWKKDRDIDFMTTNGDSKKAYCTPTVITVAGKEQLISPAAVATIAYEPRTGKELWKVYHGGMNAAAPPQYGLGRVFLCPGDGGLGLLAVRPDGSGDVTKSHLDWSTRKGAPNRTSPLLVDGLLYVVGSGGIAACIDARTGKQVWSERLGAREQYSASPLYAAGKLYFFSEDGESHVAEAGKIWKLLATNKLDDGCKATPAIAGKALFIRTKTHLYRIEAKN